MTGVTPEIARARHDRDFEEPQPNEALTRLYNGLNETETELAVVTDKLRHTLKRYETLARMKRQLEAAIERVSWDTNGGQK